MGFHVAIQSGADSCEAPVRMTATQDFSMRAFANQRGPAGKCCIKRSTNRRARRLESRFAKHLREGRWELL